MQKEEVERWFLDRVEELGEEKTKKLAIWFASRSAMRVAPIAFIGNHAKKHLFLTPAVLWSYTASWVAGNRPTRVADAVYTAVYAAADADANDAADAAVCAAAAARAATAVVRAAARAATAAVRAATAAVRAAADANDANDAAATDAAKQDLQWLSRNNYSIAAASPSLWHGEQNPFEEKWLEVKHHWQGFSGDPLAFFIDHYERILKGNEPDWPILEALAHPDAIKVWQSEDIRQIAEYIENLRNRPTQEIDGDKPDNQQDIERLSKTIEASSPFDFGTDSQNKIVMGAKPFDGAPEIDNPTLRQQHIDALEITLKNFLQSVENVNWDAGELKKLLGEYLQGLSEELPNWILLDSIFNTLREYKQHVITTEGQEVWPPMVVARYNGFAQDHTQVKPYLYPKQNLPKPPETAMPNAEEVAAINAELEVLAKEKQVINGISKSTRSAFLRLKIQVGDLNSFIKLSQMVISLSKWLYDKAVYAPIQALLKPLYDKIIGFFQK